MQGNRAGRGRRQAPARHLYRPSVESMEPRTLLSITSLTQAAHRAARRERPVLSTATPMSTPPSFNLPLGVNFDLATRWQSIPSPTVATSGTINPLSMSSDSTVWAGRSPSSQSGSVLAYNPHTDAWVDVYDAPGKILSVSAGPVTTNSSGQSIYTTYAVYLSPNTGQAVKIVYGPGNAVSVTKLPTIASTTLMMQIAAGSDGTLMARSLGGNIYSYSNSARAWNRIPDGGIYITQLSVGSAGNVWVVGGAPGPNNTTVYTTYRYTNGAFKTESSAPAGNITIAATSGGTVWALTPGNALFMRPSGQKTWVSVTNQTPPTGITAFTATSRYRAVALSPSGFDLLTYGLADQPKSGYPTWTGGKARAYAYINQQLGITATGGIRFEYTNQFAVNDLPLYQSAILSMSAPSGVKAADWQAVRSRILSEISSVLAVYQVYNEIDSLDQWVAFESTSLLSQTGDLVNLTADQQKSSFDVAFQQLFSAALAGMAKAITGGGGVVASIIASGINSAIGDLMKGTTSPSIASSYYLLQTQLNTLFTQAHEDNSNDKGAILSDPGRYLPVGAGIKDGSLSWPPGSNQTLAQNADNAFQTYFLRVLTPVRFYIQKITDYPDFEFKHIPSYDQYYVPNPGDTQYGTMYTLATGSYAFPGYPVEALLTAITGLTGASLADVLTNQIGWFQVWTYEYNNG